MKKKVLIIGNHSCSNRGDAAILRGLIQYLEAKHPNLSLDITTRYKNAAEWMFERPFITDTLFDAGRKNSGLKGRIIKKLKHIITLPVLCKYNELPSRLTPKHYQEFIDTLSKYDLVIQVGGSFFVDLYGTGQYEAPLLTINADKPLLMLGHSVGPFNLNNVSDIASSVFGSTDALVLREKISYDHLKELPAMPSNTITGADTAWLIDPSSCSLPSHLSHLFQRPCIAFTARTLAPFDKRLGIDQAEYETKMARLADNLINQGYDIIAASTCTGLDSYHRDDRMVALKIKALVSNSANFHVIMDELTDLELGCVLENCKLTIGTRLHSAILSMRFGTPAYAIFYEHKSKGILDQMGLGDFSINIHHIDSDDFFSQIAGTLAQIESVKKTVNDKVNAEYKLASNAIDTALSKVGI